MATETQEVEQQLRTELATVEKAMGLKVVDQSTYDHATNTLIEIKSWRKRWADYWAPKKDSAHKTWKMLCSAFNDGDAPAERAELAIKRELLRFDNEQRRLQEERQREAQRKAEADEEARRAQAAFEMEEAGIDDAEIAEVVYAPITAVAAPVEPTYQKAQGVSRRENWKARVVDLKKLCKAIGAGKVPMDYVEPNMTALNARAKADKSTLDLPGVEAYDDPVIAGRSR